MYNQYFKRKEFACKCGCGKDEVSPELIAVLTDVREHFQRPVIVNSGVRCESHNRAVSGKPRSTHLSGLAADIRVSGVSPAEVHAYLIKTYPNRYGIGKYNSFTHVDTRYGCARW